LLKRLTEQLIGIQNGKLVTRRVISVYQSFDREPLLAVLIDVESSVSFSTNTDQEQRNGADYYDNNQKQYHQPTIHYDPPSILLMRAAGHRV
jgi:hypothetical protein